jgi:hypothetical protein
VDYGGSPCYWGVTPGVRSTGTAHRLQLVLASTDAAYKNAYALQPVTVTASRLSPARLPIPVVG